MVTLREHIHVYKIEFSNYCKSILLILFIDVSLLCVATICFHQLEDCHTESKHQSLSYHFLQLANTGYKVCDLVSTVNVTEDSQKTKRSLAKLCQELKQEDLKKYELTSPECSITWKAFIRWFYFTSRMKRGLGHHSLMELSTGVKIFQALYGILSLIITITTYILWSMFFKSTFKLLITSSEMKLFKKYNSIQRLETKLNILTVLLIVILWLVLSALMCNFSNAPYSEALFETLSEILTIGQNSDIFRQRTKTLMDSFVSFIFYLLIYNMEMGAVLCLMKTVTSALISKRSGLCCIACIRNQKQKYNVTCPKCVVVEKELERIKRMRILKESVA